MRGAALAAAVLAAACGRSPAPDAGTPDALAAYLHSLAGAPLDTRTREVAGWKLDEATWARTVVPAYRGAYADYSVAFDHAAPHVVALLAVPADIRARKHFADDPAATGKQVRLRWALPTLYPSAVATIGGAPIDTAFVPDGEHWRALLGLPEVQLERTRNADPACADDLALAGPPGRCTDVGWAVADAAIRGDHDALTRACGLAAAQCRSAVVRPSP